MGCEWSRHQIKRAKRYEVSDKVSHNISDSKQVQQQTHQLAVSNTAAQKTKLNPSDYMFTGLTSETRVKLPGSVSGQQFLIDNCKDCDLYVLDHCASVTIDDCSNCRVIIGPTEASVFMRDCSNCSLASITRQLRCRDCRSCRLLLLCRTRPIIESSSEMAFGCYDAPYAGLAAQMAAANLSPFHNFWFDVYDFTPAGSTAIAGAGGSALTPAAAAATAAAQQNWHLLPGGTSVRQLMGNPELPTDVARLMGGMPGAAAPAAAESGIGSSVSGCTSQPRAATEAATVNRAAGDEATEDNPEYTAAQPMHIVPATQHKGSAVDAAAAAAAAAAGTAGLPLSASEGAAGADLASAAPTVPTAPTDSCSTPSTPAAAAPAAAAAVPEADRMCVVYTHGQHDMEPHMGGLFSDSTSDWHYLFVLFPAGQRAAALHWLHTSVSQPPQLASNAQQQGLCGQAQQEDGHEQPSASAVPVAAQDTAASAAATSCDDPGSCSTGTHLADPSAASRVRARTPAAVLRTNEAHIPASVMQQLATATGWSKQQVRQLTASTGVKKASALSAAACVGLELVCHRKACAKQLSFSAVQAGALHCDNAAAAKLFRDLGMDG